MRKILSYSCIIILVIGFSCHRDRVVHQDGYILFNDLEFFQFVPVKNMNLETSISSFYTENLGKGFQFMSRNKFFDTIYSMVDTFRIEDCAKDLSKELYVLKIVPVHIDYRLIPKEEQIKYFFGLRAYRLKIRGRAIQFNYDILSENEIAKNQA